MNKEEINLLYKAKYFLDEWMDDYSDCQYPKSEIAGDYNVGDYYDDTPYIWKAVY